MNRRRGHRSQANRPTVTVENTINVSQQVNTNKEDSAKAPTDKMSLWGKCMETFKLYSRYKSYFKYLLYIGVLIYITAASLLLPPVDRQAEDFANPLVLPTVDKQAEDFADPLVLPTVDKQAEDFADPLVLPTVDKQAEDFADSLNATGQFQGNTTDERRQRHRGADDDLRRNEAERERPYENNGMDDRLLLSFIIIIIPLVALLAVIALICWTRFTTLPVLPNEQAELFINPLNVTAVQLQGHTTTIARLPELFKQIGRELDYSKHFILQSGLAEGEWQKNLYEKIGEMVRHFKEAESSTYDAVLNGRSMFYFALDVLPDIERGFNEGDYSVAKEFLQQMLYKINENKILLENTRSSVKNVEGLTDDTHVMISRKMGQLHREASAVGLDWSLRGKVALSATGAVILAATAGPLGWIGIGAQVVLGGVGAAGGMWYADLDDFTRDKVRQQLGNDFGKLTVISENLNSAKESLDSAEKDITALIHVLSDAKDSTERLHGYLSPSYRATFRQKLASIAKMLMTPSMMP